MSEREKIEAAVLGLHYSPAIEGRRSGIKAHEYHGERYFKNRLVLGGGKGTLIVLERSAQLHLSVRVGEEQRWIRIESHFNNILSSGNLTAKLRRQISGTMPKVVVLMKVFRRNGTWYWVLTPFQVFSWVKAVKKGLKLP
jgi:hypothetical protein